MNAYGMDFTLLDLGLSDHLLYESFTHEYAASSAPVDVEESTYRHDGTSPLPLGMEWSAPPLKWDGRHTVWPHNPHTGWRYCVTVPSWTTQSNSRGSGPIVLCSIPRPFGSIFMVPLWCFWGFYSHYKRQYYRVQVGIQTPEANTTTRLILRRFRDFLELFSELQKLFPKKILPAPPPRRLLVAKSRSLIEERRSSLEIWMEKLLSNTIISRSAPVAIFLELEAAARSAFNNSSGNGVSSFVEYQPSHKISVIGDASSVTSAYGDSAGYEKSDIETTAVGGCIVSAASREVSGGTETAGAYIIYNRVDSGASSYVSALGSTSYVEEILSNGEDCKAMGHLVSLSTDSATSEVGSLKASEILNRGTSRADDDGLNFSVGAEGPIDEDLQSPSNLLVALPSDQRQKFSRVLANMQRRLAIAKADMEDLVARLNQEVAVRQYLTTKLTDLEVELETTKENTKDNFQQALSADKERYTQILWDMEELRKKCLEMEMKLDAEQDEKKRIVSENLSLGEEIDILRQELDVSRSQLESLQKNLEESETKSKIDLKVLVKEVKSLRSSQSDLKQELNNLMKEKLEVERDLQFEKERREYANSVNEKLLHECSALKIRLEESSVNFLVEEEEDKLVLNTSPSDATDLLTTSDNRIGLLLAEAQLLAQDVENSADMSDSTTVNELRKMVTELFIDNATKRKQMNSLIRCALKTIDLPEEDEGKEAPLRRTVLDKLL